MLGVISGFSLKSLEVFTGSRLKDILTHLAILRIELSSIYWSKLFNNWEHYSIKWDITLIDSSNNVLNFIPLILKQDNFFELPHWSFKFWLRRLLLILFRYIWWSINLHLYIIFGVLLHHTSHKSCIWSWSWFHLIWTQVIHLLRHLGDCFLTCQRTRVPSSSCYAENIRCLICLICCKLMLNGGYIGRCLPNTACRCLR